MFNTLIENLDSVAVEVYSAVKNTGELRRELEKLNNLVKKEVKNIQFTIKIKNYFKITLDTRFGNTKFIQHHLLLFFYFENNLKECRRNGGS